MTAAGSDGRRGEAARVRVVLCDDNDLARRALFLLLDSEGSVEVVGEASTFGALETMISDARPDVVLLDLNLPDARGGEGVGRLRASVAGVSVILVSADAAVEETAARAGVPFYLKGYADIDELVALVHATADRPDA